MHPIKHQTWWEVIISEFSSRLILDTQAMCKSSTFTAFACVFYNCVLRVSLTYMCIDKWLEMVSMVCHIFRIWYHPLFLFLPSVTCIYIAWLQNPSVHLAWVNSLSMVIGNTDSWFWVGQYKPYCYHTEWVYFRW